MAQIGVRVDRETFSCVICKDLLNDPVTIPCGHSFCLNCIKELWDCEDEKKIYSCPRCKQTFTPRPALLKSSMLADLMEELKKPECQAADLCYAGPEDVACDVCTGRKLKAHKVCLDCLVSYCEKHLQPHYYVAQLKKHKLVEPCKNLLGEICFRHNEVMEMFCRTDQQFICSHCAEDEHKGHDTVSAAVEKAKRQYMQDIEKGGARKNKELLEKLLRPRLLLLEKQRQPFQQQQERLQQERQLLLQQWQKITKLEEKTTDQTKLLHKRNYSLFQGISSSASKVSRCESTDVPVMSSINIQEETASASEVRDQLRGVPGPSGKLKPESIASAMDSSGWIELKPEVNTVKEVQTYSLQSDAGRYECSGSGLRWVCEEKVSFSYQFCSWEKHMEKPACMDYMPAGPLLDITVTAGKIEEAHLPHWICVGKAELADHDSKIREMFAVLHVDACGVTVERVSEVTSSHVKLLEPTFSPIGVTIRKIFGLSVKVFYDVLIYKTTKEFLTLDVYVVPPDPALKQEVEKLQNSHGSIIILKPGPDEAMEIGNHFSLTTDKAGAKIQPVTRVLKYGSRAVFEVFFREADSDFTLTLGSKEDTLWTCTIRKGDYQSRSADHQEGQHFVDRHRTALIERVTDTSAILDELKEKGFISDENYDAVRGLKSTREQMRDIHRIVTAAGTRGKDAFYEILQKMRSMRLLISELKASE